MNELHLFAGAGGGILGGMLLGHTCVCAVEIEPYRRKILLQRQRDGILPKFPIWDDIKTFDGNPWRGKVDVVCGGFPCQDISQANQKAVGITGNRSGLWKEMARVVCEVGPRFWPSPDARGFQDGEGLETWTARRERLKKTAKNGNGCGVPISMMIKLHVWGTPTCRDSKDTGITENTPENGLLGRMVKSFSGQTTKGGCVHPEFHSWLMGWPTEWTALEPLGTDKFHQWLNSHGKR